jgi:uncharacterized protein (TIGR03437 family)
LEIDRFLTCAFVFVSTAMAQTMADRVKPHLERAHAAGLPFVGVSAASGSPSVAPASLASLFGSDLARQTGSGKAPYPTTMDGVTVQIVDSAGATQKTQLLYVSPGQINFLMPAGVKTGPATINVVDNAGNSLSATTQVAAIAPAIFTANGDGTGVVAAMATRTTIATRISSPVQVFHCGSAPGSCGSVPIDPGLDAPVTVTIYATGLRGWSSESAVTLTIGGMAVPITSITEWDDTASMAGIDQVTFPLILSLRGAGETDLKMTVDGVSSNTAKINIQ